MAGIYIHIPFCKQKCSYCDFHFSTTYASYRERMLNCIARELELRQPEMTGQSVASIYFGGGTPSLLSGGEISRLIEQVRRHNSVESDCEITLEANPDDFDETSTHEWRSAGVNRLSIGIQSFDEQDLRWMNRAHQASDSKKAVLQAQKAGFNNISIDLIYGLPDMDEKRWKKQLQQALDLQIQHISAYCLTVEEKTALHRAVQQKKLQPADPEMQSTHFEMMTHTLEKGGFVQYEVSNFGRQDFFSRHNSSYWQGKPYLGIGPSAHSYDLQNRSWNISNNARYMDAIDSGNLALEIEKLTEKDQFNELLLTGLRTIWGVSLDELDALVALGPEFQIKTDDLLKNGLASLQNKRLVLSKKGLLLADGIASDLFM